MRGRRKERGERRDLGSAGSGGTAGLGAAASAAAAASEVHVERRRGPNPPPAPFRRRRQRRPARSGRTAGSRQEGSRSSPQSAKVLHVTSICAAPPARAPVGLGPRRRAADGGAAAGAALLNGRRKGVAWLCVARLYTGRLVGPIADQCPKPSLW